MVNGNDKAVSGMQLQSPRIVVDSKRYLHYSTNLDAARDYVSDSPSPSGMRALLVGIDDGDIVSLMELDEEMRSKDAHLQGVANTRQRAVTALDWHVDPGEDRKDQKLADEVASFVQEQLESLSTFPDALEHLATAIGPNIAVVELVWENARLAEMASVPGHRLTGDPTTSNQVLLRVDENEEGIEMPLGKFIVYTPNAQAGFPFRVSLVRAQAWLYVLKHYALADWGQWSELFGLPMRLGVVNEGASDETKREVAEQLRDMAGDTWAVVEDLVDFKFIETAKGEGPHRLLIEWIESKQSILYLGQTLTTEAGPIGSLALGRVHQNVRTDLLLSDLKNEARALRELLFRPMVMLAYPRRDVMLPHFVREVHEEKNLDEARLNLERLKLAKEMGKPVEDMVWYDLAGIPKPRPPAEQAQEGKEIEHEERISAT